MVGAVLSLVGGLLMFRRRREGKSLVVYGLVLGIACQIANLVVFRPQGPNLLDLVAGIAGVSVLVLFYLVVVSRSITEADRPALSAGAEPGLS
ncbi:MAG: hypothetical protein WA751_05780 [Candidatus Dormiibacterota bacterium]